MFWADLLRSIKKDVKLHARTYTVPVVLACMLRAITPRLHA